MDEYVTLTKDDVELIYALLTELPIKHLLIAQRVQHVIQAKLRVEASNNGRVSAEEDR